jgi:hypothetical protein
LDRTVTPLILALSAVPRAQERAQELGIKLRVGVPAADLVD